MRPVSAGACRLRIPYAYHRGVPLLRGGPIDGEHGPEGQLNG